jgi:putative hemolysin
MTCLGASSARIDGRKIALVDVPERRLTISKSCERRPGQFRCKAYEAFEHASLAGHEEELRGGANPGAVVCGLARGKVKISRDAQGRENAYCRFSDGSLIDCGSLGAAASH